MSNRSSTRMKYRLTIAFLILMVPLQCYLGAVTQESVPTTKNHVAWAQEFLRAIYPALNGKKYTLSLVGYDEYDKPGAQYRSFTLDVGEGPKFKYTRIFGGYAGPLPPPKDFHVGPQYYKQLLQSSFEFDSHDRLVQFSVEGPATGNPDAQDRFVEFATSHPKLTDDVVLAELTSLGAKYGPKDRDQFLQNFSTKPIARFLGPFEVEDVKFVGVSGYEGISVLGEWKVVTRVDREADAPLRYELDFEQYNGDLVELGIFPNRLTPKAHN
jgi:hypothetical protein